MDMSMRYLVLVGALVCSIIGVFTIGQVDAATVYVDPSCPNNGDGTAGSPCAISGGAAGPFNTWSGMTWTAGNTYSQQRGTTYAGQVLINASGSGDLDSQRIILDAYGPGDDPKIHGAGSQEAMFIDGARSYITLRNYNIYGSDTGAGADRTGLRLCNSAGVSCTSIKMENLTIHDIVGASGGFGGNGIWGYCTDCTMDNVTVYNIPTDGINIQNIGTFTLRNSYCHDVNTDVVNGLGDCVQLSGTATTVLIEDNILDHTSNKGKQAIIDNTTGGTNGIVRRNQFLMGAEDNGVLAKAAILAGDNTTIYANKIIGGDWALSFYESGTVYGNVIGGARINGWVFSANSKTVNFHNNTLYTTNPSASFGIDTSGTSSTINLNNNIFRGFGTAIKKGAGITLVDSTNLFYDNTDNDSGWTINANNLLTNPLQVSFPTDLRTQGTSPARRAGIANPLCIDVRSRPCWSPPDIGAYQATSGDPAAPRAVRTP